MVAKKALFGCLALMVVNSAYAQHVWNGPQGNPAHTGFVNVKSDPAKMHVVWSKALKLNLTDDGRRLADINNINGVMIANQTFYIAIEHYFKDKKSQNNLDAIYPTSGVIALDAETGIEKWQQLIGFEDRVVQPVYDGTNRLLVAVRADDNTRINAFLSDSGVIDYTLPLDDSFNDPQAFNGNLYTQTKLGLSSINTLTGKLNWTRPFNENLQYSHTLAVGSQYLIQSYDGKVEVSDAATGKALYLLKSDGWEDQLHPTIPVYDEKNQMVYHSYRDRAGNSGGSIFAFDLADKKIKWASRDQWLQPVLADDEIYVVGEGRDNKGKSVVELHAVDPATGKQKWSWRPKKANDISFNYEILATADLVIVPEIKRTVAISRKTHQLVWEIPRVGLMSITDNRLFIVDAMGGELKITAIALS